MDIQALAEKHGGMSASVVSKAQEYARMLDVKLQGGGSLVPVLQRPAACLELACELLQEPFDSKKLCKFSGGTSVAKHKQCVRSISSILRVQAATTITTSSLCIKFGCPTLKDFVAAVQDEYKQRMMAKLTLNQQRNVDMTRPLFPAAVFYACAQKAHLRVDKNSLIQLTRCQPKEFASVVTSIETLCKQTLSNFIPVESTTQKKRKRKDEAPPEKDDASNEPTTKPVVSSSSNTRSLEQIKKLIEQRSVNQLQPRAAVKPTPKPSSDPAPAHATHDEYVDWKKKILAQMKDKS
ncbi:hypothetical protein AeMF1_013264 [Aphanomyces euteiches]|nr:hypothetical protein AeMF1_013264 [Aphanomyces euteiches]KAH9184884.1 hypothetical protein AeNC1_013137 [Aphanomyces euteiches]